MILTVLPSVQMRVASAILTAQNRERFTVLDKRPWNAIRATY
jgi:hypothetical protein